MNRTRLTLPLGMIALLGSGFQIGSSAGGNGNVYYPNFPEPPPERWDIFLSYSENNEEYAARILLHLKQLEGVKIFSYSTLKAGSTISDEARSALLTSVAAVMLISIEYLVSDLMRADFEGLLDRADRRGVRILWIQAGTCDTSGKPRLTRYQRVSPRAKPLDRMRNSSRDVIYQELVEAIKKELAEKGRFPSH
jgi:hypothetical protein